MKEHKYIRRTKKHYGVLIFIIVSLILIFFILKLEWVYKLIELIIGGINNGK